MGKVLTFSWRIGIETIGTWLDQVDFVDFGWNFFLMIFSDDFRKSEIEISFRLEMIQTCSS